MLSAMRTGRCYPRRHPWYSFLLEAESTPGPYYGQKNYVNVKFQLPHRESNPDLPACSAVPQPNASPWPSSSLWGFNAVWWTTPFFWIMTPCHWVTGSRRFEGIQCLHLQRSKRSHGKGTETSPNILFLLASELCFVGVSLQPAVRRKMVNFEKLL